MSLIYYRPLNIAGQMYITEAHILIRNEGVRTTTIVIMIMIIIINNSNKNKQ